MCTMSIHADEAFATARLPSNAAKFAGVLLAVLSGLSVVGAQNPGNESDPFNDHDNSAKRKAPPAVSKKKPLIGRLDRLDPKDADWNQIPRRATCGLTGPRLNPDDQYRFFWFITEIPWRLDTRPDSTDSFTPWGIESGWRGIYPAARDAGFNLFIGGFWEYSYNDIRVLDRVAAERHALWDQVDRDGLEGCERLGMPRYTDFKERFACREIDTGKKQERPGLDLSRADTRSAVVEAARRQANYYKDAPAVTWIMSSSEVRDHSIPTATEEYAQACRQALGFDPPRDIAGSRLMGQKNYKFPANGVIDPEDPTFRYLWWFWKSGDQWNRYQEVMTHTFEKTFGRRITAYFEPGVRCPPIWGSGGRVDAISQWVYSNPLPYMIDYIIAEQQAMARGCKGQGVLISLQGITYRSRVAPVEEKVANPPDWYRKYPNVVYPTTPPDTLNEQLWTVAGRRVDGVGVYPWNTLFDCAEYGWPKSCQYQCTTNGTIRIIAKTFAEVYIPLGPLLRAIPEREPDFAAYESSASALLSRNGFFGWGDRPGPLLTAANLSPAVIYDEDLTTTGVPPSVKVLALVACRTLTRPAFEAIEKFRARGGRVIGLANTASAIKLDATIPQSAPDLRGQRQHLESHRLNRIVKDDARKLKELLVQLGYRSCADTTNPDILVHLRSSRTADYLFAVNDRRTFGDYVGQWKHFEEMGLPTSGSLILRKPSGAVYDLVAHKAVSFEVKDGVTEIPVDIPAAEGRILMAVAAPLKPLTASVRDGKVTVTSPDSGVLIPIRVERRGGKPYSAVVKDGIFTRAIEGASAVVNLATGERLDIED